MSCPLCGSSRLSLLQKEPASPDRTRSAAYTERELSVVTCSDCTFMYVVRDFTENYVLMLTTKSELAAATVLANRIFSGGMRRPRTPIATFFPCLVPQTRGECSKPAVAPARSWPMPAMLDGR